MKDISNVKVRKKDRGNYTEVEIRGMTYMDGWSVRCVKKGKSVEINMLKNESRDGEGMDTYQKKEYVSVGRDIKEIGEFDVEGGYGILLIHGLLNSNK